jgi:hypothetical protein
VATLGIVEYLIFLLQMYYPNLDNSKYKVFVKVHFMLFYTAVLNALQSIIVAMFAMRTSHRMWVQTETLELNHYVEIREEFERVSAQLEKMGFNGANASTSSDDSENENAKVELEDGSKTDRKQLSRFGDSEFVFEFNIQGVRKLFRRGWDRIKYPRMKRKHDKLLVQVRFHELRVHFLQAYKLPLKLRISDYLIRSEQQVLIKLVHVSTIAWLLLTVVTNLLYFCLGLVSYKTDDKELVETTMIWIFFWCLVGFLALALLVYNKMKSIFRTIMHEKTLWSLEDVEGIKKELGQEQLSLFWGGDPKLVIVAIQFMQFGFAIALSILLIFWDIINEGGVGMEFYVIAVVFSYSLFVAVVAKVIPQYTLCTSLGQLVDQKRLNETVAHFHLEEAKYQRLEQIELEGYETLDLVDEDVSNQTASPPPVSTTVLEGVRHLKKTATGGVKNVTSFATSRKASSTSTKFSEREADNSANIMAELVKLDTSSLRTILPVSERVELSKRETERARRRGRRKSVSDGVAALAALSGKVSSASLGILDSEDSRPKKTMDDFSVPVQMSSGLEMNNNDMLATKDPKAERLARRHRRKKSMSDGVAAMAWTHSKRFDESDLISSSVPEDVAELPQDTAADLGEELVHADEISVESTGSEDGQSDVDDVPDIDPSFIHKPADIIYTPGPTLREKIRAYYLSKRFVLVSNVFGTLFAFFLVGQRIERFLHTQGIVSIDFVSFDFNNKITFWTLTAWLLLFLANSALVFYSVQPFKGLESNRERSVVLAAGIDAVLTSVCLTMLLIGEVQRCCDIADDSATSSLDYVRNLAEDKQYIDAGPIYEEPAPCACPIFGSREYGGLGRIEPFAALIGLRIFRHALARRIVRFMDSQQHWSADNPMADSIHHLGINTDPFDVFDEHGATEDMEKEVGTISELWEVALGKFPDIAAKHGEFSSELLQAMLGLLVIEVDHAKPGSAKDITTQPDGEGSADVAISGKQAFVGEAQYAGLSPDAQEIIVAGRVGKKVMSVQQLTTYYETGGRNSSRNLHFKLDTSNPIANEADSIFTAPNARLVRSMRRCDRKLLPILDKWTVVDVVMTRFEMVYFDVADIDDPAQNETLEHTRQAVIATKGGKGLRLCDVAAGRRVVGRLQFSDVSSAHVEREMQGGEEEHGDKNDVAHQTEYWKHRIKDNGTHGVRNSQWNTITQDRLKIQTVHGHTLYLRYYSDLEYAESHRPEVLSGSESTDIIIIKNNSFQWIQTIVRYCGPEQLKQPLPHFGDDNDDELRDYLISLHEGDSKPGHRRGLSSGDPLPRRLSQLALLGRPSFIRRASTLGRMEDELTDIVEGSDGPSNDLVSSHGAHDHRSSSASEVAAGGTDQPAQEPSSNV